MMATALVPAHLLKWKKHALGALIAVLLIVVLYRSTRASKPPFGVDTKLVTFVKKGSYYTCPAPAHVPFRERLPPSFPTSFADCKLAFVGYRPSPVETYWKERADEVKDGDRGVLCNSMLEPSQTIRTESWLGDVRTLALSRSVNLPYLAPGLMSEMQYSATCGDGSVHEWSEWIEPLTLSARHPFALTKTCCTRSGSEYSCAANPPDESLMSIDYLVLQSRASPFWSLNPGLDLNSRSYLFDVGTSFFDTSMLVLACTYRNLRAIDFDAMYGWEFTPLNTAEYWSRVPPEFKERVTFSNEAASAVVGAPTNPLTVIKAVAKPSDFVALKLDIDHTKTELAILKQILDDPAMLALVDEVFYEYHFDFPPMYPYWFAQKEAKVDGALEMFARARKLGLRMHFWP
eukprot:c15216_g1_i1.p1 GENE.c15216_g1_i1~~c15216_g1_i1.p1  ORF type:complete len:403 (-),score=69.04 c15216_g1_i1:64-1272(-)